MDRRKFLLNSLGAGLAISTGTLVPRFSTPVFATSNVLPYDLVAVMGGEPVVMFDKAIASLGGMRAFVKRGQTVVVKPNIGWDSTPERAANTNPKLVKRIVEHCFEAGAKDVYVFDHTCDNWNRCYSNSGIQTAVRDGGGKIVSGASESYYHDVTITGSKRLKTAKVHELILDSDVFINVPILKDHSSARLTIAMKNLMGVVWDRRFWHRNDLHQCIAEFPLWRKPDLNVVDAYAVMMRNGPRGVSQADIALSKSLIVSPDIVAADAAAAKIFGSDPSDISYIKIANELGLGTMDLNKLNINRIRV